MIIELSRLIQFKRFFSDYRSLLSIHSIFWCEIIRNWQVDWLNFLNLFLYIIATWMRHFLSKSSILNFREKRISNSFFLTRNRDILVRFSNFTRIVKILSNRVLRSNLTTFSRKNELLFDFLHDMTLTFSRWLVFRRSQNIEQSHKTRHWNIQTYRALFVQINTWESEHKSNYSQQRNKS